VDAVRQDRGRLDAPWLATNWGSDLLLATHSSAYLRGIRSVLAHCGYYRAACHRDVALARAFGFRGAVVGIWPTPGGIDIDQTARHVASGPPSTRRGVVAKAAMTANTRGQVVLDAVESCADALAGWELCLYDVHPQLDRRAADLAAQARMMYTRLSLQDGKPAPQMLATIGRARVSISLNRFDGLSNALVEAMALAAFPLLSTGGCGRELALAGRTALFVDPDDVPSVSAALRRVISDDRLVDRAAARNRDLVERHLDRSRIRARIVDSYERIAADRVASAA
jgi:glycosyltransferase involved in cell wall biosynthesis